MGDRFDNLPRDVIIYMAMLGDLPEILAFCRTSPKYNKMVCQNQMFWRNKLERDYNIIDNDDPRGRYNYIWTELIDWDYYRAMVTNDNGLLQSALNRGATRHDRASIFQMKMATLLDLPALREFCQLSAQNYKICNNNVFWREKILIDMGERYLGPDPERYYIANNQ